MKFFFMLIFLCFSLVAGAVSFDPDLQKVMDLTYQAKFSDAEKIVAQYISSHPDDPLGYLSRGTLNSWKQEILNLKGSLNKQIHNDYEKANNLAEAQFEADSSNIDKQITLGNTYMYLARIHLVMKKKTKAGSLLKKARNTVEEALKKDPNRHDAYLAAGIFNFYAANIPSNLKFFASLLGITGNEPKGLKQLETAASNPNPYQNDALFILALAWGDTKKNFQMAEPYIKELTTKFPGNPNFRFIRGEFANKMNDPNLSQKEWGDFLTFCSKNKTCNKRYQFLAHYNLSGIALEKNNDTDLQAHLNEAFKLDEHWNKDKSAMLHYYRGMIYKKAGNQAEALDEFKQAKKGVKEDSKPAKLASEQIKLMGK